MTSMELSHTENRRKHDRRGVIEDRRVGIDPRKLDDSRFQHLLSNKIVSVDQLSQAFILSKKFKKSVEQTLLEHFNIEKDIILKSISNFYNCPYRTYSVDIPNPVELIHNLKKSFLLQDLWVPVSCSKDGVEILINDPTDLSKIDNIKSLIKSKNISFSVGFKEDIVTFINNFFNKKPMELSFDNTFDEYEMLPDVSFEEEIEEERGEEYSETSSKVVKLVDQIIVDAWRKNASDIHIEPSSINRSTSIRFRIDGVCTEYMKIPISLSSGILSRLKIMAGLDISEKRLPQDGKFRFNRKGIPPFELRIATYVTAGGHEDAVLRVLAKAGVMNINDMGLSERNLTVMKKMITKSHGLILVVGPTGSGKTNSLHSALNFINNTNIKILTAEDPIEITQPGLRQVEVKRQIGFDFAMILRSFLRADPDVIMIGEMRDFETASIVLEACLTGHLVLSTLHTNSAPETVVRLLDMGMNPLNFSDALIGILAQRLVRKLCDNCKESYHPSREEFEDLVNIYGKENFKDIDIKYTPELTLNLPSSCDACNFTGYKGRMGIFELMENTVEMKRIIKQQFDTEKIFKQAYKDGMITLKQDGIIKVFQGLTDINEVRRVCG
jgi:type II secretory ATPase GspE/PulE/Tfp pilus assembly ATPase PilB-like protein